MPYLETMRYCASFPKNIPLYKVGCIRVTHPCAGRQQVQALLLPLDLHVLGLPLAFILSQDQTLRCKYFKNLTPLKFDLSLLKDWIDKNCCCIVSNTIVLLFIYDWFASPITFSNKFCLRTSASFFRCLFNYSKQHLTRNDSFKHSIFIK